MNRALVWIGAAVLAVGPLALVGSMRPMGTNQTESKPLSAYVLMDGPVAASTDDVVAVAAENSVVNAANHGGTVMTSLAWTGAVGALVLAAWAAVAAGDALMARGTPSAGDGVRRAPRRGWRFAVPGAARWGTAIRVGE